MRRLSLAAGSLAAMILLSACGGGATTGSTPTPVAPPITGTTGEPTTAPSSTNGGPSATESTAPTAGASEDEDATSLGEATLTPHGLGPIQVGMSLSEAQAHGWVAKSDVCDKWDANKALLAKGVSLAFVDDQLAEVVVFQPGYATESGIKVGDSLASAQQAYGADLKSEKRRGGGGEYQAHVVTDDDWELLFGVPEPGDATIKNIRAKKAGTPAIEGC